MAIWQWHGNKSMLNNLKNLRSDIDSAHAVTLSQAIAEEERVIGKKIESSICEKNLEHVQGLEILFNFIEYASYVTKYAFVEIIGTMKAE